MASNFSPLSLAASALILLGAGAAAQESTETPQETVESRARTYVLHMEDGRVLRTKARQADGHWQVKSGGDWVTLPGVERATPERELLGQAKKLKREAGKDPIRQVAYTQWLIHSGLLPEALASLDKVLGAYPDQPDALALIERTAFPVALPPAEAESLETFCSAAAKAGPAVREIAVREIAAEPDIPGLKDRLTRELVHQSPRRRSFATLALRRLMPGQGVQPLLSRAILDSSGDVRRGASLALRDVGDQAVCVPVIKALGSRHPDVRKNAVDALATMNYNAAVEPLYKHLLNLQRGGTSRAPRSHIFVGRQMAYVQDFDVEVASGQAIADPVINVLTEGAVLDTAVIGVHVYVTQAERAAVRRALVSLTGANPGNTTAAWKGWWKEHGDEWQVAGTTPQGPPSSPVRRED